jgi:hypothetical protein
VAAGVLALVLSLVPLAAGARSAQPAAAAVPADFVTFTIVNPGCTFNDVTAKAATDPAGTVRGFASFHGGSCGAVGRIWFFEPSGAAWSRILTPWSGRVLGVAMSGSATFVLFQKLADANQGIWVAKKPHGGALTAGRRLSTFTGQNPHVFGDIIATGDKWRAVWSEQVGQGEFAPLFLFEGFTLGCMPGIVKRQFTFLGNDEHPSLALRGTNAADLVFERNDGAVGNVQRLLRGTVGPGCQSPWELLALSGPGQNRDTDPELFRTPGVNHATWARAGRVVYASDAGAAWSVRHTSAAAGRGPELAVTGSAVFAGFTSSVDRLRLMKFHLGGWQEGDLTTGSNPQRLVGVFGLGASATAIGASFTSYRLYAVPGV